MHLMMFVHHNNTSISPLITVKLATTTTLLLLVLLLIVSTATSRPLHHDHQHQHPPTPPLPPPAPEGGGLIQKLIRPPTVAKVGLAYRHNRYKKMDHVAYRPTTPGHSPGVGHDEPPTAP
ncbi:hypothetical protein LINPERHAP1_LOCUS14808 [Linum perenne]